MMLLVSFCVLVGCVVYFFFESLRLERRRKHMEQLVEYQSQTKETVISKLSKVISSNDKAELEKKFVEAGYYNKELAKYYFPAKVFIVVLVSLAAYLSDLTDMSKLLVSLLALITIIIAPDALLDLRRKALIRRVSAQLPYLLDMMSVCVQTGMTIEASLLYLAEELESFDSDLCYQIKKTSDMAKIHGLEKSLNDLSERVPTTAVRSFVLTVIQNLQYGTSISNVLSDLAEDMRKMQILTVEEKVGKLSAKMSVPLILFIMFPIVVLILAPGIMQMSLNITG
ncbi:type II secretion system F family protein [Vibrio astriarenae]|uniref:type II secretion system F family protein n=1 Tax=Vibrio astriarenae TaxID=1481923 RepID=UPI003735B56A